MNNTLPTTSWTELKRVLGLNLDEVKQEPRRRSANSAATITDLMQVVCSDGERTEHMMKLIGALIASNMSDQQCLARCHEWNARNQPPLPEEKISLTFASIRRSDRQNHPDKYPDLLAQVPLLKLADGRIDRYVTTIPLQRRWLIKDLVVLGKVGAVVAPGGSSKSQWLLQLGASIATGVDLAGHWKVGETGGVLMLCAEDDVDEIHRRIHRIRNRMAQLGQGGLLPKLIENLFVFSTIGVETLLTKRQTTGEVEASINIDRIAALAGQIPNLRLIIIDPISRFRGGEENSNEDATRFVEALERLAKLTCASVLAAHHTNKSSYNNSDAGQGAARGASALTDGLRWQMNLSPPTEKLAKANGIPPEHIRRYVASAVTKTNYSAIPDPVLLERDGDGYLTAVSANQLQFSADMKSIRAILGIIATAAAPMTARAFEDQHGGTHNASGMSKSRLRAVLKLAIQGGFLEDLQRKPLCLTPLALATLGELTPSGLAPTDVAPPRANHGRHRKRHINQ